MSFSLGADVKVVLIPALVSTRLSWGAISGMYVIHAKVFFSSSVSVRSTFLKGSTSNNAFVCVSWLFWELFVLLCVWLDLVLLTGGT